MAVKMFPANLNVLFVIIRSLFYLNAAKMQCRQAEKIANDKAITITLSLQ